MQIQLKDGSLCNFIGDKEANLKNIIQEHLGSEAVELLEEVLADEEPEDSEPADNYAESAEAYCYQLHSTMDELDELINKVLSMRKVDTLDTLKKIRAEIYEIL